MSKRPRIKLKLTFADKAIEVLGFIALAFLWVLTLSIYKDLPDTIPIHFNGSGTADDYGSKSSILALPIIATILFSGLTFLNKFPHIFNYSTEITLENAEKQYRNATRLLRFLKTVVVIVFTIIVYQTQQVVAGYSEGLGQWFLPLFLGLTFIPILLYLIQNFKSDKKSK